jgi:hypothetical protein
MTKDTVVPATAGVHTHANQARIQGKHVRRRLKAGSRAAALGVRRVIHYIQKSEEWEGGKGGGATHLEVTLHLGAEALVLQR